MLYSECVNALQHMDPVYPLPFLLTFHSRLHANNVRVELKFAGQDYDQGRLLHNSTIIRLG